MVQRLTYRRHCRYNTKSNKVKVVKLPGGRNTFHHVKKSGTRPKCGDCKNPLHGLPALRPIEYSRLPKYKRRVTRAYGGSRCHKCVRNRIIRAFLREEQKCVKAVLFEKERLRSVKTKSVAQKPKGSKTTKV